MRVSLVRNIYIIRLYVKLDFLLNSLFMDSKFNALFFPEKTEMLENVLMYILIYCDYTSMKN